MSNKVKDINIKNPKYYFFKYIININFFDPNNIKIDEKPYKSYIGYVRIKKHVKVYSVNLLYLIFSEWIHWRN